MFEENEPQADSLPLDNSPTKLQGNRLFIARIIWGILAGLCLLIVVAGFPIYVKQTQDMMSAFGITDFSLSAQVMLFLGPLLFLLVPMTIAGIIVFLILSDDWMGLLVSLTFLTNVVLRSGILAAVGVQASGILFWAMIFLAAVISTLSLALLIVFPNGSPVPRWAVVFIVGYFVYSIYWYVNTWARGSVLSTPVQWLGTGFLLVGIAAQIFRYFRTQDVVHRQQIKWLLLGVAIAGVASLGYVLLREPLTDALTNVVRLSQDVQTNI